MGLGGKLDNLLLSGFKPGDRSDTELDRIRMINVGLITMVVIGLPFSLQYLVLGVPLITGAVIVTCLAAVFVILMLRRGASISLCGYLTGTNLYLLLLLSNLNSGGFYDPNFAWFYVVPLVGAVLVDARAAWVWSGVIVATTIAFWLLHQNGVGIPNNIPEDLHATQSLLNRLSAVVALGIVVLLFVRAHNRARKSAFRLAFFDELTGLPNRRALMTKLTREIERAGDDGLQCALLFVDLDRFKTVNDSLGHRAGDQLLRSIGVELEDVVRAFSESTSTSCTVARFGGDEFAVVAGQLADRDQAQAIGNAIVSALDRTFKIDGYQLHAGGSVGVALCPTDGDNADELLRSADLAMYQAKGRGGMQVAFCTKDLVSASKRWMDLEAGLRRAIDDDELHLVFQPIVDLESREITAVEALLRWQHNGERIGPAEFIPVAEATGAILPIGAWVLRRAHEAALELFEHCNAPIRVSVNVSVAQLRSPDLRTTILELIEDERLPRGWLELELTESVLLEDYRRVTELMSELGGVGVEFAIDDFGTGYSSLAYLASLPVNRLKVDREFINTVAMSPRQLEVTNAIFAMAERLGLPTVAEGIECEETARLVGDLGCIEGQGHYFSKPVTLEELYPLLTLGPPLSAPTLSHEASASQRVPTL